jgi:hypothetical protein
LQLQLNKRYARGFTGQVSYTLGKAWDTGSDVQIGGNPVDARDLDLEWGPTDFDIRHRIVGNWLWELPFFKDRGGVTGALLGGWQVNGITQYQTGFPFNVNTNAAYPRGDFNGDGVRNDRPNTPSFGTDLADSSNDAFIRGVFAASDFPQTGFVIGNLPRNAYYGPRYLSTDLSFFKNFTVRDDWKIQFRAEAFNAFNNVNLRRPEANLANANFGRSTQAFAAREIQFALKLIF